MKQKYAAAVSGSDADVELQKLELSRYVSERERAVAALEDALRGQQLELVQREADAELTQEDHYTRLRGEQARVSNRAQVLGDYPHGKFCW